MTPPPCQAQWSPPRAVAASGQTVAVDVFAAKSLDSSFLNPQSSEAGRRRGPVALAKKAACWAGWTDPARIQVAKARFLKLGYLGLVPSCCSQVERAGVVSHLQMPALV